MRIAHLIKSYFIIDTIVPKAEGSNTTNEVENSPPKPKKAKTPRDPNSKNPNESSNLIKYL